MTLDKLNLGHKGKILVVKGHGAIRQRLLDMGLTPKTIVKIIKHAPLGDPIQIRLRDYELTLRKDDAKNIEVEEMK